MKNYKHIQGVMPIIPTPFTQDEDIDENGLRSLVEFAISAGVEAACLPAYASEFYKLTDEEKLRVVKIAVEQADGRIQIIGQCNHSSLRIAVQLAQQNEKAGADILSIAVPRIFNLPEESIADYLGSFMDAVPNTPILVQDFNPGGSSISVQLICRLMEEHLNFQYLKLEEPLCAPKFKAILEATDGRIGLFEGWGGLYMLELIPLGIAGIMPGLGVSDFLQKIYHYRKAGENDKAFSLFQKVMPQIFFALQNMELFHYVEKELLVARGILKKNHIRKALYTPDPSTIQYVEELNSRLLALAHEGIPV